MGRTRAGKAFRVLPFMTSVGHDAAMLDDPTPNTVTEAEMIDRARALAPVLAGRRREALTLRRLPDANMADLIAAGMFKLMQPRRLGGLELPYGAQVPVAAEVAKACGASGWLVSVIGTHHWMLGKFDPRAQDDVWAKSPDAISCSAFGYSEIDVKPAADGFRASGRWTFSSGSPAAHWAMVSIPVDSASGQMGRRFAIIPKADFQVLDNWHASGLRGSGSSDIVAKDIFIPAYRTIDFGDIDLIDSPGTSVNPGPTYRLNTFLVFNLTGVGPALGCARSALDAFTSAMKRRRNVMGSKIPELQNIQMRTSEAGAEIAAAEALIEGHIAKLRAAAAKDGRLERGYLLQFQRDCAYIGRLCQNAVARLSDAQGAHGLAEDNVVNLAQADLRGICAHMTMGWDANCVPWGKHALGIEHQGLI